MLSTFEPRLTIGGFNTSDYERAYENVEFVVRYAPRAQSNTACGEHEETYRINSSGVPQRRGTRATLTNQLRIFDRTERCVYHVQWPEVTGFGVPTGSVGQRPGPVSLSADNPARTANYISPTFFPTETVAQAYLTLALIDDVTRHYGDTPGNVMTVPITVRPKAGSHAGCDANTGSLSETAIDRHIDLGVNGNIVSFDGSAPLILRPHGADVDCVYSIEWAEHPVGKDGHWVGDRYVRDTGWQFNRDEIRSGQTEPGYRYTVNRNPTPVPGTISPDVNIVLPWTDYDDNNEHDYAGAEFWARFTPQSGQENRGCSEANTEFRYVIDAQPDTSGGSPVAQLSLKSGSPSTLVDQPSGTGYRCSYDVVFSGGDDHPDSFANSGMVGPRAYWQRYSKLANAPGDDVTVSGVEPRAQETYQHSNQNYQVTFAVDADAAADDETFVVRVEPVSGSGAACSSYTQRPTGADDDHALVTHWMARHSSEDDFCEYVVTWPDTEDGGTTYRRSGARTMRLDESFFAQQAQTLRNTYTAGTVMMVPELSVTLSWIDEDDNQRHDMEGDRFTWRFTRSSLPEDVNCSELVTGVYEIKHDGEVELAGTQEDGTVSPGLELVGWHRDSESECTYTVSFGSNADFSEDVSWGERDTQLSWSDPAARARFFTDRVRITARFQAVGLGVPAGTMVTVWLRHAASNDRARCWDFRSSAPGGWTNTNRVWSRSVPVGSLVTLPSVVTRPARWTEPHDRCDYEVEWSDDEDDGPGGEVRDSYPRVARPAVGAEPEFEDGRVLAAPRSEVTYRAWYQRPTTYFAPAVSVSVPFDDDGSGSNRFAGETVTFTYARVASADGRCTSSAREVYTVGTGRGARGGTLTVDAAARLVDEPVVEVPGQLSRACSYRVSASSSTRTAGGSGAGQLGRTSAGTATIDANGLVPGGGAAAFTYESVFVADVDISVPDDSRDKLDEPGFEDGDNAFKGGELRVTFTRTNASPEDCLRSPRTVVFTVGDGGTPRAGDSAAEAALLTFVDQVPGESNPCEYTVEFPSTVSSAGVTSAISWLLTDQDGADDPVTVSRANSSVTRRYERRGEIEELLFVSPVRIAVPADVDNNVGVYAGAIVAVAYAASGGAHCVVDRPSVEYQIPRSLDGGISATGGHPVLISQRPSGQRAAGETPCTYTATLPPSITSAAGVTPAWTLNLNGNNVFRFDVNTEDTTFNYVVLDTNTGGTGNNPPVNNPPVNNPPVNNPPVNNPPVNNPPVNNPPVNNPSGGAPRPTSGTRPTGGGGGGSRPSGGGSSGGSGGGAATGPWVVAAASRVPVAVSLAMPVRDFPVGTAIEVMLNVPGTCGDDVTAFAGLPANIGLVYALNAQSGTTAAVLAANALRLAGYAERGEQTRNCEVRITLITAPAGCRLQSADGTASAPTDEAGRTYVELTGGQSTTSYSATPRLVCG